MRDSNLTPREYCAGKRSLPFMARRRRHRPGIYKIGRGILAVVGTEGYVEPYMLYGVEITDSGRPQIYTYWIRADNHIDRARHTRIYSVSTLCHMAAQRKIDKVTPITYDEMATRIRTLYPRCFVPDPVLLYAEYGLTYDEATGEIHNPLKLI